jgi:hypothetical protein
MARRAPVVVALLVHSWLILGGTGQARAYRPFDSTDADVAAAGELELELGPVGFLRPDAGARLLVAPAVIVNLGVRPGLELVLEGQHLYDVDEAPAGPRSTVAENGLFLKGVVRRGELQGSSGASVALEGGVLLPEVNGDPGWGAEALAVLSLAGRWGTVHLNGVSTWTRQQEGALGAGVIVEAPELWRLRPVAEVLHERTLGGDTLSSALLGAIWEAADAVAFDTGARLFEDDGRRGFEVRLGLTWKMQLWNGG